MCESRGCFKNNFLGFQDHEFTSVQISPLQHFEEIKKLKDKLVVFPNRLRGYFLLIYQGLHFGAFWPPHLVPPQIPSIFSLSNDVSFGKNIWLLICFQVVPCSNITWPIFLLFWNLILISNIKTMISETIHRKSLAKRFEETF